MRLSTLHVARGNTQNPWTNEGPHSWLTSQSCRCPTSHLHLCSYRQSDKTVNRVSRQAGRQIWMKETLSLVSAMPTATRCRGDGADLTATDEQIDAFCCKPQGSSKQPFVLLSVRRSEHWPVWPTKRTESLQLVQMWIAEATQLTGEQVLSEAPWKKATEKSFMATAYVWFRCTCVLAYHMTGSLCCILTAGLCSTTL